MGTIATLVLVGAILLVLETLLPGLIAGAVGFACLAAAVVVAYVNFGNRTGHFVLLGVLVGLVVGTVVYLKYFPDSRVAQAFVSKGTVGDIGTTKTELLNQSGTAVTELRPSGTALIGGKRIDVVTDGSFVERGTPVRVVAVEGMRVVVRPVSQDPAQSV